MQRDKGVGGDDERRASDSRLKTEVLSARPAASMFWNGMYMAVSAG